jgi:5-methyltetrahydrofolate--homocysteine methyltransferase
MGSLIERLHAGHPLIADGATGSLLLERGLEPGACPEFINLEAPVILEEIALSYLEAGAEMLETNTFGASPLKLAAYDLEDRTEEINQIAVQAVRTVGGDRAYVAGSVGPCGKLLEPYGDTSPEEVRASFHRQARCLLSAGVDCICIETMIDLTEANLAIGAFKETSPATPVMATMTFDATPRGYYTMMGVSVEDAAAGLTEAGADIIGSNCGNGIERMIEIAQAFKVATSLPLIIQSNAGLPQVTGNGTVYPETPEFMAEKAAELAGW